MSVGCIIYIFDSARGRFFIHNWGRFAKRPWDIWSQEGAIELDHKKEATEENTLRGGSRQRPDSGCGTSVLDYHRSVGEVGDQNFQ